MSNVLNTTDFKIDYEKQTLFGILYDHEPTLLGYRFTSKDYPDIEGVVYEYFHTSEYTILNVKDYDVPMGTFFGTILILEGWELIKSKVPISFTLDPDTSKGKIYDLKRVLKPGEIYSSFKRMNKPHELSSFYIDIRGGSTEGAGKNEHGKAHFHLLRKNSREEIAKIYIPSIDVWNCSQKKIDLISFASGSISNSDKKELVDWMNKDNNLEKLHKEWYSTPPKPDR